jgi:hypothetical protein
MAAMRGTLTDPMGGASIAVEGKIDGSTGELEFADNEAILQGVLEGRTFHLTTDDGTELDIAIASVSPGSRAGSSRGAFSQA